MADQVRELVIKVSVDADIDGLKKVEDAQESASTKTVALGTALGNLAADLAKVALQAAKAGAALIADIVFGTAEAADGVAKMSQRLQVAPEQLQRMTGAVELLGGSSADLNSGLRDLEKGLGEAISKGSGPAIDALSSIGLEVAEVDALLSEGDLEGTLGLIGEALEGVGDKSIAQAASLKLFGGSGAALAPLLRQGTDGITELGDQISATGSVIEDDALVQFEQMADAQLLLSKQVDGVKNTIAVGLAPAVTDISDRVGEWVGENEQFISQDLPEILESVANAAISLTEFTIELITSWREFIRDATDLAEIIAEDVEPGLDSIGEQFASLTGLGDGLSLALADITISFLEAVGAGEELIQIFKEIRDAIPGGGDEEIRVERGAGARLQSGAALEGGASREGSRFNIGGPKAIENAAGSGDRDKLDRIAADASFSPTDRALAETRSRELGAAETAKAERAAADKERERASAVERSRAKIAASRRSTRRRTTRERSRGGAGGGGGAAEPTVEDLIGLASGPAGASPAALRSASSALSGTLLVNQDNSVNITTTVQVGGVQVSTELSDLGPTVAGSLGPAIEDALARQNRETLDLIRARQNVGFE